MQARSTSHLRRLSILALSATAACQPVDDANTEGADASRAPVSGDASTLDVGPGRPDFFVGVDAELEDAGPDLPDIDVPDAFFEDAAPRDAQPDMAPPATDDVECPRPWISLDGAAPRACRGRRVVTLDPGFGIGSVAIARSNEGLLAMGWTVTDFADSGSYLLRVVNEADLSRVVEHDIQPESNFGESAGFRSKIEVLRESFHVALWSRSDFGGAITYRQIRPDGVLTEPEPVDDLVGRQGSLDIAVSPDGAVDLGWHDQATGVLKVRTRAPEGEWNEAYLLDTDLETDHGHDGAISLAVEAEGLLHVGYQLAQSSPQTAPRARSRVGAEWTIRRTLDNFANARVSGVGVDVVALRGERAAAYVDWVGGTGELRLVRWRSGNEEPTVEILEASLPMESPPPRYPLALAADDEGLLHLAMVDLGGAGTATLEYRRQARIGGRVRWLVDTIDDEVEISGLRLDMALDPVTRTPHILYFDPQNGFHAYATIREPME